MSKNIKFNKLELEMIEYCVCDCSFDFGKKIWEKRKSNILTKLEKLLKELNEEKKYKITIN